ncbi:MAG: SUMF1/EgtB/PvdO family nonheme iron enzyme [Fibrobacteraceae bacterium]|nr:SUMF1/EgtB/PvdO family nonheme iron enzyme [Fibrobacteraceae bacterium]
MQKAGAKKVRGVFCLQHSLQGDDWMNKNFFWKSVWVGLFFLSGCGDSDKSSVYPETSVGSDAGVSVGTEVGASSGNSFGVVSSSEGVSAGLSLWGENLFSSSSYIENAVDASSGNDVAPVLNIDEKSFTETVNGISFDMVFVKGGSYTRGCNNCASQDKQYESPEHLVTVDNYFIAKYEVTNQLWNAVMGGSTNFWEKEKAPKIGVSWFDANAFMCKLNSLTGKTYRLLTDGEWEFAAKGGSDGVLQNYKYSGSNSIDDVAWYSENSGGTSHEVGTKAPNDLGLYDMSGNAWEWVYDWLVSYSDGDKINPVQLTGSGNKTRRGGSYDEPADFARVTRRAIRSRDGAAGMGFRIGLSKEMPGGMDDPCRAANPQALSCTGDKYRDCRLITGEDEAWIGESAALRVSESGFSAVSGYPTVQGEWYTLNNRSFNVVSKTGTKTYAYYVFSEDEMTMISEDGMPYRMYRKPIAEATVDIPSLPLQTSATPLATLISKVEPERMVSDEELMNPDTSKRDARIMSPDGYTWFFDGRCCGGNHKYRFHLDKNGDAEFVVMDYDDSHKENVLARGRWFTVGNIALHIVYEGKYFNYLYTSGNRSMSFSEYMPQGPIFCHISFQDYERGDFRIFNKTLYDDNIKRPKGFNGEKPVYDAGEYQVNSD